MAGSQPQACCVSLCTLLGRATVVSAINQANILVDVFIISKPIIIMRQNLVTSLVTMQQNHLVRLFLLKHMIITSIHN